MKTCFKCEIKKPLSEFYRHNQMLDGRLNKCKECTRKDTRENRAANIEYYRKYDRNRSDEVKRKEARQKYFSKNKNDPAYKARKKLSLKKYAEKNPLKRSAHIQWGNFIRNNPWLKQKACSKCSANDNIQAHHEDYTKPLDVVWLCKSCHGKRHREINEEIRAGISWSNKGF